MTKLKYSIPFSLLARIRTDDAIARCVARSVATASTRFDATSARAQTTSGKYLRTTTESRGGDYAAYRSRFQVITEVPASVLGAKSDRKEIRTAEDTVRCAFHLLRVLLGIYGMCREAHRLADRDTAQSDNAALFGQLEN